MNDASKFNISISGPIHDSTVSVGDYNTIIQHYGFSPAQAAELEARFRTLRMEVGSTLPPEEREEALARADELERAVVAAPPDPGRVKRVLAWFTAHAPAAAGAVLGVVVHPLVGKIVEGAGTAIGEQFGDAIGDAGV